MVSIVVYNLQVLRTLAILGVCGAALVLSATVVSGCKKSTATAEQDNSNSDIGNTF